MQALILAGGSGTRFWPLSRRHRPKQLLVLEGERSLLQQTMDRLHPLVLPADVWVCTTERLADDVRQQLPEVPPAQVLAEPEGRNTAPAIGWAIRSMPQAARQDVVAVLPADRRIADDAAFRRSLGHAGHAAESGERIITLGVRPSRAETGYGYLELGRELDSATGLAAVGRFREKPDAETARAYLEGGRHLWNAGIFVFRGDTLLAALAEHQPVIAAGLERIAAEPAAAAELYPTLPAISIDHGVMEQLTTIATLPLDCGWNDLGSWEALTEVLPADSAGNMRRGEVLDLDTEGCLLYADRGTVAALGVKDLVIVRTDDTVLVLPKERSQEVRRLVAALKAKGSKLL